LALPPFLGHAGSGLSYLDGKQLVVG